MLYLSIIFDNLIIIIVDSDRNKKTVVKEETGDRQVKKYSLEHLQKIDMKDTP